MRKARAGIVILLIVAAISLYALASLAAAKYAAYRDELLAEVGALESETARLTEDAVPGPGEEISRAAQGQPEQSPAGQTEEASTSN